MATRTSTASAFSRFPPYMTGHDGPECSRESSQASSNESPMSVLQDNKVLTPPDAEKYKGHKVVAMPSSSFGGLSVREMVSSRSSFNPDRPRSLSAGRATTRSRDIVQEVYDRMGVSRGGEPFDDTAFNTSGENSESNRHSATPLRTRESAQESAADKFSQRYKAAAALSSPHRASSSRSLGDSDGNRRSRSLSRGRAVAGRWPPGQSTMNDTSMASAPAKTKRVEDVTPKPRRSEEVAPTSTLPSSPKTRGRSCNRTESQDETVDSDSGCSKESQGEKEGGTPGVKSVKDRISAYAGVRNSARNFPQRKPVNYQTYSKIERPPKIDIYEEARRQESGAKPEVEDDTSAGNVPEPSAIPPSAAAAAAADAAAELVRRNNPSSVGKSSTSTRTTPKSGGGGGGVSGLYLSALRTTSPPSAAAPSRPVVTQTTSAPLTEIAAVSGGSGDNNSIAASSMSGDDFPYSPTNARKNDYSSPAATARGSYQQLSKKPSWTERKSQNSPGAKSSNGPIKTTNSKPLSASDIEKIVEQRVQARVSVIEMRMEEQMQRLEKRMEERMKANVELLESKIDKMNSMLSVLVSRELGASRDRGNEI